MLCLARAIGIWGNKIMPTLVTRRAEKGLRPAFGLIAEEMERCPVMVFSPFSTADLTNKLELKRIKLFDFDVGSFNCFALCKPRYTFTTVHAIERVFRISSGINVMANCPSLDTAMLARLVRVVNFIFPRGICHEAMPILR